VKARVDGVIQAGERYLNAEQLVRWLEQRVANREELRARNGVGPLLATEVLEQLKAAVRREA
jgi:hypothetical protein